MATHRAPSRRTMYPDTAPPHLMYISMTLGVIGLAFSSIPDINTWTGMGAAAGFAVGIVGIWRSRQILSGVAVVLCGAAVMLTLLAMSVHRVQLERDADLEFHLELPLEQPPATQGVSCG